MAYTVLAVSGLFLGISLITGVLLKNGKRYLGLLAASLVSVAVISRGGILFLLLNILFTHLSGLLMNKNSSADLSALEKKERKKQKMEIRKKNKRILVFFLCLNLSMLVLLKYFRMFTGQDLLHFSGNLLLPIGLSYYTLQSAGYMIDVFRGKYPAEKNPLKTALFICFFPQLYEGPFGRYDDLGSTLYKDYQFNSDNLFKGSTTILKGLFKIFMIAARAAIISDSIFAHYDKYGGFTILLGGAAFVVQLYAEFSGYIDVARGISEILGIRLAENFNLPFISENVSEFWRRWHISLGSWFRDYVFYPVSTSKWMNSLTKEKSPSSGDFINVTLSLFIVWILTGLWHGASFKYAIYGLYYFILMVCHNLLSPYCNGLLEKYGITGENPFIKGLQIIKTWFFVTLGMILFRAENLTVFFKMILSLFTGGEQYVITEIMDVKDLTVLIISIVLLIAASLFRLKGKDLTGELCKRTSWEKYAICFAMALIIIVFGAYGPDYVPPDPVYGGF